MTGVAPVQPTNTQADLYARAAGPVRLMPPHPLGTPGLSATDMADFGAIAAARGLERGDITGFMQTVQATAAEVSLRNATTLLDLVDKATKHRVDRIAQAVRAMPDVAVPGLAGLVHRAQGPTGLISRNEVLMLLTAAASEAPVR